MAGYATLGAAGYGASDFLGGIASRRTPIPFVMAVSQTVSLIIMVIGNVIISNTGATGSDVARGAVGGVLVFAGIALVYAAFSRGDIGPAAALLGVWSAVVPVLAAAVTGDPLHWSVPVGMGAAFVAVFAFSDPTTRAGSWVGALLASGGGAAFGSYHVVMSGTHSGAGLLPVFFAQVVVVILSTAWLGFSTHKIRRGVSFPRLAVAAGAVEAVASVAALYAVRSGNLAVVGVILALAPAASVLLARVVLGERLTRRRAVGLAAAAVAVTVLAGAA